MRSTRGRKTSAVVPRSLLKGVSVGMGVIPLCIPLSACSSESPPVVIYPAMDFDAGSDDTTDAASDAGNDEVSDAASDAPPVVIYPAMDFDAGDAGDSGDP